MDAKRHEHHHRPLTYLSAFYIELSSSCFLWVKRQWLRHITRAAVITLCPALSFHPANTTYCVCVTAHLALGPLRHFLHIYKRGRHLARKRDYVRVRQDLRQRIQAANNNTVTLLPIGPKLVDDRCRASADGWLN